MHAEAYITERWGETQSSRAGTLRHIVHLGPSVATARLAAAFPGATITAIEHSWPFAQKHIESFFACANIRLIVAPLVKWDAGDFHHYDLLWLEVTRIDLLIIDGPPGHLGKNIRSGAEGFFHAGLPVILDDSDGPDEAAIVKTWVTAGLVQVEHPGERFCALRCL